MQPSYSWNQTSAGSAQEQSVLCWLQFNSQLRQKLLQYELKIQHTPSLMGFVHLYCWLPRAVRGAKPGMKKCNLGKIVARISSWTTYYYKPQEFSTEQKMLATRILSLINTVSRKDSKIIQGHCTLGREPCWQPISWDLHSAVQGTLKATLTIFFSDEVNDAQWIMAFNNNAFSRNLRLVVTPDMVSETRWFKSP